MAAPKDTISERNYTGLGVQDIHLYGTLGSKEHVNLGAPQDSISEGNYTGLDVQDIDLYDAVGSNARINVGDQHTDVRPNATDINHLKSDFTAPTEQKYPQFYKYLTTEDREIGEKRKKLLEWNVSFFVALGKEFPFLDQYCPLRPMERVCTPCPQGWLQFQAKCYYFSTELNNWEDSRIDCIKQGSNLVIIESVEEQEFIRNHTTEDFFWIGLRRSKGIWTWVDGTYPQKTFWVKGEPDNYDIFGQQSNVDCVVNDPGGRWADTNCMYPGLHICEVDFLSP
ncbi:hypothetical protein JZ751_017152 [Albula glossodonta]|uniref:C-type lectin domain-containing protein n=1 Tax=Albula glossodonta TaxID=121402 RepID=A0A8T2NX79_9TELE|nr:hypothetical protein JZ751_017152 [Albula glossodonta]